MAASNALGWPMSYQWVRNGTDIPEATQPTYTFITALADEGTRFAVRVSKFGSVVTTLEVVLTVIPDLTPPPSWRCMAPAG